VRAEAFGSSSRKVDRRTTGAIASVSALAALLPSPSRARADVMRRRETTASRGGGGFFENFLNPDWKQARALVQDGMRKFLDGDVQGSVAAFDSAIALDAELKTQLWQRGLSLYYAGEYELAAEQFRSDVALNPNDTEEALWAFLSEAQVVGSAKAREQVRIGSLSLLCRRRARITWFHALTLEA